MKNKKNQKGFSALAFVIIMSAMLTFLVVSDAFEEQALQVQLSAVEKHDKNFYEKESENAFSEIEAVHNPL